MVYFYPSTNPFFFFLSRPFADSRKDQESHLVSSPGCSLGVERGVIEMVALGGAGDRICFLPFHDTVLHYR